ncbi:MAG TPA: cytochrome P450, partial [Conexibacter sp.]|nr:cytochrome P450 [Conexibacter sp.]
DEPLAIREPMGRIAFEVLCQLVLGVDAPARRERLYDAIAPGLGPKLALMALFPTLWRRDGRLNPGRGLKRRRDVIHRMVLEEIASRRADPNRAERDDALSLFVDQPDEAGRPLGDLELRDQLISLLLAGHDTMAATLAWAVERVSRTPRVQARLARELGESDRPYLEAVIRETLRTRPSVVDVPRRTTTDVDLGGHRVPAGTMVNAMLALTQRRADLWDQPLEFRPERFLTGGHTPYSYVPFGGGRRRCIGAALATLQMEIVLTAVLSRFVVHPGPGPEEPARLVGMTLVPAHGGRVILRQA